MIIGKVQQIITGLNNQLKMYSYLDKYAYIPEMKLFQMAPSYIRYSYSHFQSLAVLFIVDINVRKEPIWKFF